MGITAPRLNELGLVDQVIEEPLGGAHRDFEAMAGKLKETLVQSLNNLQDLTVDELLESRYQRYMSYGIEV